jgi:hypothetical protein
MTRSNHPLILMGICALSATNAVALSNDIQNPHHLFRLRKSALNSDGSNDSAAAIATSVEASVEAVVENHVGENQNEWLDTNRQKDDDELLSMDTGGADGVELQDCMEVKVCPDPACAEMEEAVEEGPTIFSRKSLLLRRHLESLTKSGKSATTAETTTNDKPVFLAKSGKMTPPDSLSPPTNGEPATTIFQLTQVFSTKSGKVSKAAKGCKSGKGCKMVLQCTSTKSPAGTGIVTAPPVSVKKQILHYTSHVHSSFDIKPITFLHLS